MTGKTLSARSIYTFRLSMNIAGSTQSEFQHTGGYCGIRIPINQHKGTHCFVGLVRLKSYSVIECNRDGRNIVELQRFSAEDFDEVFVSASLSEAEARDPKGLYRKARAGELPNFTGIDSAYEAPVHPELILDTEDQSVEQNTEKLVELIESKIR